MRTFQRCPEARILPCSGFREYRNHKHSSEFAMGDSYALAEYSEALTISGSTAISVLMMVSLIRAIMRSQSMFDAIKYSRSCGIDLRE